MIIPNFWSEKQLFFKNEGPALIFLGLKSAQSWAVPGLSDLDSAKTSNVTENMGLKSLCD